VVRDGHFTGSCTELILRVMLEWDPTSSHQRGVGIGDGSEQIHDALCRLVSSTTHGGISVRSGDPYRHAQLFGLLLGAVLCDSPDDVLEKCGGEERPPVHLLCATWPYLTLCSPNFSLSADGPATSHQNGNLLDV
jgi:hypothetical protein